MKKMITVAVISLVAAGFTLTPRLSADEWDKSTTVTFSAPVEIPGQVLPPGTYVFKLLDSQSSRNVVQIFDANQTKLYASLLAIPDHRLKPADKTLITFEERAADSPEAIQAWFYPGDDYGQQFVYPKEKAVELAKTNNRPVPSMPASLVANTQQPTTAPTEPHVVALKQAPVKAQQPEGEEVEIADIFVVPSVLVTETAWEADPQTPTTLPSTASPLWAVTLGGLVLAYFGLALLFIATRVA
jgi:hypothetical protein